MNPTLQGNTGGRSSSSDNEVQTKPLSSPNFTKNLESAVNVDEKPENAQSLTRYS